jgi:hypothetical protein
MSLDKLMFLDCLHHIGYFETKRDGILVFRSGVSNELVIVNINLGYLCGGIQLGYTLISI